MKTYCAFLRGVNVNGKTMKMAKACKALTDAGFSGVVSVLASGNLIFQSDKPQSELGGILEQILSEHCSDYVCLLE